jgi:hypothetical protein
VTVNLQDLDPGVRQDVLNLNLAGFQTTDSGDGVSKPANLRAFNIPHIVIIPAERSDFKREADHARAILGPGWDVEVSWSTRDRTTFLMAIKLKTPETCAQAPDVLERLRAKADRDNDQELWILINALEKRLESPYAEE